MKKAIILLALFYAVAYTQQANYILIRFTYFTRDDAIVKKNGALLITDKREIAENEKLLHLYNSAQKNACGYNFDIELWQSADKWLGSIPIDRDCDHFLWLDDKVRSKIKRKKIRSKMKGYIKQLETKPTHYIYDLKIPTTVEPDEVIKAFEGSKFNLFSDVHTFLSFSYLQETEYDANGKNATQEIEAIIDSIKKISIPIIQPRISRPWMMSDKDITIHGVKAFLNFKYKTDLRQIKEIIESNNGRIEDEHEPSSYESYEIQLVDTSGNIETIKEKLKDYKFIMKISERSKF
jgi:hypothetical protein